MTDNATPDLVARWAREARAFAARLRAEVERDPKTRLVHRSKIERAEERARAYEARLAALETELHQVRTEAARAVDETHRSYRRDLVPVQQAVARYNEAAHVLRRLSGQ